MLELSQRLPTGVHLDIEFVRQAHILDGQKIERNSPIPQFTPNIRHIGEFFVNGVQHNKHGADGGILLPIQREPCLINNFFGDTITVTGLLTGQDITEQLLGKKLGGTLLLSESMVMRGSDIFLDDMTVPQLEKKLNVKIKLTPQDGARLFDNIVGIS